MKKTIAILLILTMLLLTGCEQAWEDEAEGSEPEMHIVLMPEPGGGIHPVPMWY